MPGVVILFAIAGILIIAMVGVFFYFLGVWIRALMSGAWLRRMGWQFRQTLRHLERLHR